MSKGLTIALIVAGCLLVTCFGGGYLIYRNFVAPGGAAYTEGASFAATTDNNGCLGEARSRVKADPGMANAVVQGVFLMSCLEKSAAAPGFCDGIPAMRGDSARASQWIEERCPGINKSPDPGCLMIEMQVQNFCHPTKRG